MEKREHPYVWPSLLAQYMTGEKQCMWAAWMRAQYKDVPQLPRGYDEEAWQTRHTALLQQIRDDLSAYPTFVEKQNKFFINGASATLGGNADIVAQSGEKRGTIYDAKGGRSKDADMTQVLIYMYALPRGVKRYEGWTFDGEVYYSKSDQRPIPAEALTPEFIERMGTMVRRFASEIEPERTPSFYECRFCSLADCPERMSGEQAQTTTTDF